MASGALNLGAWFCPQEKDGKRSRSRDLEQSGGEARVRTGQQLDQLGLPWQFWARVGSRAGPQGETRQGQLRNLAAEAAEGQGTDTIPTDKHSLQLSSHSALCVFEKHMHICSHKHTQTHTYTHSLPLNSKQAMFSGKCSSTKKVLEVLLLFTYPTPRFGIKRKTLKMGK